MIRFDLGGVRMGDGTPDSNGVIWGVLDIQGWDAPEVNSETERMTGHHGAAMIDARYAERPVVLRGVTIAPTAAASWAAQAQLRALVPLLAPTTLTVYETVSQTVDVVQSGRPLIDASRSATKFTWSLSLKALSPFKRGAAQTVALAPGASATVAYAGTWPGAPTITTTAAGTLDVANATTATRVQSSDSLPSGTVVVCAEPGHTVYSGATNLYGSLVQPVSWLRLLPGNNTVSNAGTAAVSLSFSDLYL